jgi:methionine synthase I (cobalamin-dependent)
MKLGGSPGEMRDFWNVSAAEKVLQVARSYVEAGSKVILTNTFSSNRAVLEGHGAAGRAAELSKAGAEISRRAAAGKACVFASMGPTGKMVSAGELSPEAAAEIFAEQAAALAAGGVDALCLETFSDLEEARAGLQGCLKACSLPVGVSFTFDSGKNKDRTMMGVTVEQAYGMARDGGASFVGANCGLGIEAYVPLAQRFVSCGRELPVWIKGNAGKPEAGPNGTTIYRATPEVYARAARPLFDLGVRFMGGCCGSTPAHIRAMADALAGCLK